MPSTLLSAHNLEKSAGSHILFRDLSFGIFEKERIGLIGSNGAGKSSLLKILAGLSDADEGDVKFRKNLKVSYVPQEEVFSPDTSILELVCQALMKSQMSKEEALVQAQIFLSFFGFEDLTQSPAGLSGGWLKKLSLAKALSQNPELLILDEPTNHLDWTSILNLEKHLQGLNCSFLIVSHDRDFLHSTTHKIMEINKAYPNGHLSHESQYYDFIKIKQEILEAQLHHQNSLQNKAKRETAWLRAGVKARTTKNQGRIKEANELLNTLENLNSRNLHATKRVSFSIDTTERQTKKIFEIQNLNVGYPNKVLLENFNVIWGPKTCIGLVGENGSGKTTFLKTLLGQLPPLSGKIKKAQDLKVLYYEQKKEDFPEDLNLMQYLADGSDYVTFKGNSVHAASYASHFLFNQEKMTLPLKQLSGGEKAKLSLAKALLQPADILVLDEPTNDLDMESIDFLEGVIQRFQGLCFLVSHDRRFLSNLSNQILYFDSKSTDWTFYSDLSQCLKQVKKAKQDPEPKSLKAEPKAPTKSVRKLSYKEKKFLENAEEIILQEEEALSQLNIKLEEAVKVQDSKAIQDVSVQISKQQEKIEQLYTEWSDLDKLKV